MEETKKIKEYVVIKGFTDAITKKGYILDSIYTCEDKTRIKYLKDNGYIKEK